MYDQRQKPGWRPNQGKVMVHDIRSEEWLISLGFLRESSDMVARNNFLEIAVVYIDHRPNVGKLWVIIDVFKKAILGLLELIYAEGC